MPVESKNRNLHFAQKSTYWTKGNPSLVNTLADSKFSQLFPGSVNKVQNPSWKVQIVKLQDASTGYERYEHRLVEPFDLSVRSHSPVGPSYWEARNRLRGDLGGSLKPSSFPNDTVLSDRALGRLKNRLRSHTKSFNALVPLAELRDLRLTLRSVVGLTTSLTKGLLDIREKRGKGAPAFASDAWLTYSFGIKPLVSDVQAASAAIDRSLSGEGYCTVVTGTASKTWQSVTKNQGVTGAYNTPIGHHGSVSHELGYRYVAGVRIKPVSANDYSVGAHLGFDYDSFVPTLWELAPYSWLVDYFTTTGAYFSDVFESDSYDTIYVSKNSRYKATRRLFGYHYPGSEMIIDHQITDSALSEFFWFKREKLSSLPTRSLRFKTVDEVGQSATNKLLNLAALLFGRRRKY